MKSFKMEIFYYLNVLTLSALGCNRNTNSPSTQYQDINQKDKKAFPSIPDNHRLPCTGNESTAIACLNGGTCLKSQISNQIKVISCQCTQRYIGTRCHMINPKIIFGQTPKAKEEGMTTAGFAAIPIICVAAILFLIACIVFIRNRQNSKTQFKDQEKDPLEDKNV